MEDMRELEFPALATEDAGESTSKQAPTADQLAAVDGIIDAMDMSAIPEYVVWLIILTYWFI